MADVLDLYARRVVGWAKSSNTDADLLVKALNYAWKQSGRPERVMFHSGQRSQYTNRRFRQRLRHYRTAQSMSRSGNCWSNAPMERLFRSLKSGRKSAIDYQNLSEAQKYVGG
ncbi:hypothetical protein J057_24030 [Marinobacter nanhaiticus D15-8W]|uniref:Integrase catalytic domain-containing protein n=1 Tax=Marinobacter nanhaiticus D15-8W TaxID=626887 RepID=A0A371CGE1_9GAMM|nr:hypothetical protein J057_24030 [Marinobacter nanhaiticus D15-8W]